MISSKRTSGPSSLPFRLVLLIGTICLFLREHQDGLLLRRSALFVVVDAKKLNRDGGHHHRGTLGQYAPGPFDTFSLSGSDENVLSNGKSIMKQIPADPNDTRKGGKAICVQDVCAPKSAVWNQILDMNAYLGKVNKLKECKNYYFKKKDDGNYQIKTKMVVGVVPGYSYEYYCDHTYFPKHDSLTWSLDYDKLSDFDDVAGHWHVEDHPKKQGQARVFYACDIKFRKAVPKPVMAFLTKAALKQATAWVKRESETKPSALIPTEFQPAY